MPWPIHSRHVACEKCSKTKLPTGPFMGGSSSLGPGRPVRRSSTMSASRSMGSSFFLISKGSKFPFIVFLKR